ncbi:uncharacterized protein [Hoplias malabaricus]|uniref:uncharacterized protein isoform X2 n=1 Tax=Hoplias malabaricus TaxID=27720 RepID=UPI003462EB77
MELDVCVEKKEDEITQDHAKVQSQEEISRKVWASIKKTTPSNADLGFSAPPVLRGSSFCEEVDSLMMDRMSSNTERVLHKAHPSTSGPTVAWNVASLPTSGNLIEPSSNECSDTEDFEAVAEESKDCEGQGKKAGIKYSQDLGNEEGNILVQKVQTSFFKPHIIMVETCPAIARLFPTWQNDTEAQEEDDDEEAPEQISGPTVACSAEAHLPARGNSTKPSNNEVKEQEALAVDLEIEQEFTLERVSKEHKDCVGDGDKEDKVPVQPAETSYSKPAIAVVEIRRPTSGLSQAWQIDTEGQASEETVPCSKPAFPVIETLLPTAKPFQALKDITRKQEDEKPYSEIHSNIKSPDTEEFEAIAEESKDCEGQGKKAGIKYYQDLGNEEGNFLVQKVQTSSFKPHIIMVETCPATARLFPTWQNDIEAQEEDDDEEAPEQISGPTVACSAEAHLSARGNSTKPSNNEVKEQEALAVDLEIEQEFTLERVSKEHKDCVGDGDKEDRVPVQPAETSYSKPAIAVVEIRRPTAGPSQAWQNDTEGQVC